MGGRKNVIENYHAIVAQSMASNITQATPTNIQFIDNVCIILLFTGTPTGTFTINGSIDKVNWVPMTFGTTPQASGSAGSILLDMNQLSFPWIQIAYTASSGTGTLDAWISGKEV